MSALPPKADSLPQLLNVRFVPQADIDGPLYVARPMTDAVTKYSFGVRLAEPQHETGCSNAAKRPFALGVSQKAQPFKKMPFSPPFRLLRRPSEVILS
jgi:hypothetical protein